LNDIHVVLAVGRAEVITATQKQTKLTLTNEGDWRRYKHTQVAFA
jgi:hypothetical protein